MAGARVVAVFSPTLARAQQLAKTCDAAAYDALDAFLEGESLDMVIVGTPSGLHGAHGSAAARHRVHVLVEKPIDITVARADALIADAREAGVTLGVIFQDRLKPGPRALKSQIDSGALGTPVLVRAQVPWWRPRDYYAASAWRGTWSLDGGGVLMNQAIHTIDLLGWLCGPIVRVSGRTATRFHSIEVEDTAAAVLEFSNGALGTLEATTCAYPGRPRRIEVSGTLGTAVLEGDSLLTSGNGASAGEAPQNASSPTVSDPSPHRAVFLNFIEAVRNRTAPCCDGPDARRSVAVVEAIYASSRGGTPVLVKADEFPITIQRCD